MAASLGPAEVPIWLGVSLATLFVVLSGFHFLWALGARSDLAKLVPTVDGRPTFRPGRRGAVRQHGTCVPRRNGV